MTVKTRITFAFGDGGAEFKFFDYEDAEPAQDAEPTYAIQFAYDELWQLLTAVFNGLQKSPGRRSLWSRIKAALVKC